MEVAEPKLKKSKTERLDPKRPHPYIEMLDPNFKKLRIESALPKFTKSNTERLDPNLLCPYTDNTEPHRR
jgi:hypothetical protein